MNSFFLPYYSELESVREFLEEEIPSFPLVQCNQGASLVSRVTELITVAGGVPKLDDAEHVLSWDPLRNLLVDLTRDQYSHTIPSIVIEKPSNSDFKFNPLVTLGWYLVNATTARKENNKLFEKYKATMELVRA